MTKTLVLAGGCFWCVEHDLREAEGVVNVTSGYSGGESENPTYESHAGHREVVLVEYDDSKTSYKKLLQFFIDHIDPTDDGGQFADRGESYRTAIYYETDEERKLCTKEIEDGQDRFLLAEHWASRNPEQQVPDWIENPMFPRGSKVTFRFRELTDDGIPKEARYWRKT